MEKYKTGDSVEFVGGPYATYSGTILEIKNDGDVGKAFVAVSVPTGTENDWYPTTYFVKKNG